MMILVKQVDPKVYTKKYFEGDCEGWTEWLSNSGKKLPERLLYAFNLAKIKKGMKVLDFGSGRGEISYQASMKGADVLGMDYSKTAIELTKKLPKPKKGKLKFIHNKTLSIPLSDNSIDVIFFLDVIEHLYPKQVNILLKEFFRVLKPGGKVILHTAPNRIFYDYGYPYFTRYINVILNVLLWKPVFKEELLTRRNPRTKYDFKVHINECSEAEVNHFFLRNGFRINSWFDSSWRKVRIRDKFKYTLSQPSFWPVKWLFAYDIWAIAEKN